MHWAFGRWGERGGFGLALALHMGFNWVVVALAALDMDDIWAWGVLGAAGLLLAASFRWRRTGGVDAASPAA
jgi:hypothetical protein